MKTMNYSKSLASSILKVGKPVLTVFLLSNFNKPFIIVEKGFQVLYSKTLSSLTIFVSDTTILLRQVY